MNFSEIEKIIGYEFKDKNLLTTAFTHSTYANEKGTTSNERLEFLGDALVDFVAGESFYLNYPKYMEGKLTAIRKKAVCRDALAEAKGIDLLCPYLRLAKNVEINPKIQADLFEAICAAIYIDAGFEVAKQYILTNLDLKSESLDNKREDYKSELLELSKKLGFSLEFRLVEEFGPQHAKTYVYSVMIDSKEFSTAQGSSKKRAEQSAAKIAFQHLLGAKF